MPEDIPESLPRETTFCQFALNSTKPLIVNDCKNDERFKTEDQCWAAGMIKGPHLLEKTSHIFGVPVRGSFSCQKAGQNA